MFKGNRIYIVLLFLLTFSSNTFAQCAMCKAQLESGDSNLEEGINDGIIYLMIVPYLLLTLIVFVAFRGRVLSGIKKFVNS